MIEHSFQQFLTGNFLLWYMSWNHYFLDRIIRLLFIVVFDVIMHGVITSTQGMKITAAVIFMISLDGSRWMSLCICLQNTSDVDVPLLRPYLEQMFLYVCFILYIYIKEMQIKQLELHACSVITRQRTSIASKCLWTGKHWKATGSHFGS
jgi:hypothetical protein